MHAPQIIVICLYVIGVTVEVVKKDSIGIAASLTSSAINAGLMYWGGFFG